MSLPLLPVLLMTAFCASVRGGVVVSERCVGALVSFFRVLSLLHHCNKTRVYFFVGDMAILHECYNLQILFR